MITNGRITRLPARPDSEPAALRDVMSQFGTGVTVLTVGGRHNHGMTANAFTSVSLDPPLVLCCVANTALMHAAMSAEGLFGVSVLAADQEHLAKYFADRRRPSGIGQFHEVDWSPGPRTGAPLLGGALAWLECEVVAAHVGGDHSIFVGRVLSLGRGPTSAGLLFFDGGFHRVLNPARSA